MTRIIISTLMLLMYGTGEAWADISVTISALTNGSITQQSIDQLTREVTLTVTPASGYYIKASDIEVEPLVDTSKANSRGMGRSSRLASLIVGKMYEGSIEVSVTVSPTVATYKFTLPENYDGAYVSATFRSSDGGEIWITGSTTSVTYYANGHYILADDINASVLANIISGSQTLETPFAGTFEGEAKTDGTFPKITGLTEPLFASTNGATIKNVMLDEVAITTTSYTGANVGAFVGEATGATRIYNCGVLATGSTVKTDEDGYTSITSCSSSISGSGYVGGIVGLLDGTSRVINCFSYADVSGGSYVGGIVGYNNVATTSAADNLKTMVMNCMFYGEVSGTSIAPIYNGKIITNRGDKSGVSNFNYFRLESAYIQNTDLTKVYNCALGAETRFLQRFEFFRHLLNSHLELAGWWATGTYSKSEMLKWVMEPSQIGTSTPYPILKTQGNYPSVVNYDAKNARTTSERNAGGKLGTLTVNIQMGSGAVYGPPTGAAITTSQLTLTITDKDPTHYNFNYYKVQLPYYNDVGSKNYNGYRVVTGWKIVSITGGTPGSYTVGADATIDENGNITASPYNFADRNCTNKDLYSVSGRVFNQGAYWDVPEGVTAITIEPYWAKAAYVADAYADVVYKQDMSGAYDVPNVGGGQIYTNRNSYTIAGESQMVFTSKGDAIATSNSGLFEGVTTTNHTVYDYAVVLVGNYHFYNSLDADKSKPYTVTSIDLDGDNEPDYSYILRFDGRAPIHPARVDFINIPGLGMAQKSTEGTGSYNFGILQPKYFFESTNTSLFRVTQFEYDAGRDVTEPFIVQGGVFEQWVGGQQTAHKNKITYFHVGGNVWFKEFHRGTHQDQQHTTKHPPLSVTGGDYDEFYLTGLYRGDVNNYEDNAECYINGGRFGTVCGAAQEGIGKVDGAGNTGNIVWQIQNADIKEFFAGGLNADKPVTGNLSTTITGSHVGIFCGGPKFGDMSEGKKVFTNATDCEFGTFFGAGYGGNSYSREAPYNHNNITNFPHNDTGNPSGGNHQSWNDWLDDFYLQEYNDEYGGVSTQFNYQFLPMSNNKANVARIFVEYVKFSLATTHDVTSSLTGCTITGNFYGGGSLGKVQGDVTSTLTNCTVKGSVFGAGYSASLPTVEVMDVGFQTEPWYYKELGTYRKGVFPATTTYHWEQVTAEEFSNKQVDNEAHILYTTADLTALGTVTRTAKLTIDGYTTLTNGKMMSVAESVYGGGEESSVNGNTEVIVNAGTIGVIPAGQTGGATYGNVYGGGKGKAKNKEGENNDDYTLVKAGLVKGNTNVTINGGSILHNVYGGGAFGSVGTYTYDGSGNITGHTDDTGTANITIKGGTIGTTGKENGMVFGSSRGDVDEPGSIQDRLAWVHDTHVIIGTTGQGTNAPQPQIKGSVYGSGENGHTYSNARVDVHSGTIGIAEGGVIVDNNGTPEDETDDISYSGAQYPYRGNIYGGGCGTDKYYDDPTGVANPYDGNGDTYNPLAGIVLGNTQVNMDGGLVVRNVYGAGAMGSVGAFTKDNSDVITFSSGGTTSIAISGGTVGVDGDGNGNVFGAARGDKAFTDKDLSLVNETDVTISGSTTIVKGNVYGGGEVGNVHTNTKVDVLGGTIAMNVFGGGKGVEDLFTCEQAMVGVEGEGACQNPDATVNINKGTIVTISNGTVGTLNNQETLVEGTGNVYGGGEIGRVEWNTQVRIGVGSGNGTFAPEIYGSVFGAGKGLETHGYSALVRGNSTVTVQGNAKVRHNVYGGGEKSTVGRYWVNGISSTPCSDETQPTAPDGLPAGMPYKQRSGGICRVTIQGSAKIGPDAGGSDIAGHVFGAGKGIVPHFSDGPKKKINTNALVDFEADSDREKTAEEVYLEFLQTLALITNSYVTIDGSAIVKGNVYGGSESGFVQTNTNVTIKGSNCKIGTTTYGDVFGGGKGLEEFAEAGKVKGNTTVAISNGTIYGNVYGGGQLGDVGLIDKTDRDEDTGELTYNYAWKQKDGITANVAGSNTITGKNNNTGMCMVTITGGIIGSEGDVDDPDHGNVFGAGRGSSNTWWCEKAIAYNTIVYIEDGTVYGTVYGGGQIGRVEDDGRVTIGKANESGEESKPDIRGDVFGAGAGLETHGYSALLRGNAKVTVQGIAKVGGNVYGGGETASVGKFTVVGGLPSKPDTGGTCTVTIQDGATIGASGTSNHVFGACKGVNPATITDRKSMQLYTNRPKDASGNYKPETDGSWSFYPSNHDFVWVYYTENEYPAFLRTLALTSNTNVTIDENSTINGSVYGGGERGVTLGTVVVNMNGGTVNQDVYGGGALADTNKGNWDVHTYVEVSVSPGVSVAGLYTRTGSGTDSDPYVYTEIGEGVTAVSNGTYYRQGTWATDQKSALYTTTVNLIGGEIHGDAYGGGLGQKNGFNGKSGNIAAQVYGDVNVVLGTAKNVTPASATAFNITHYDNAPGTAYDESTIIKSGRVFGCNNLNGSPQGDVTVRVWRTVTGKLNGSTNTRTAEAKKKLKEGDDGYVPHTYEVAAVYGGGNLANYNAIETGKIAHVIIETCDVSVETVYGGGNAAEVPGTNVLVKGAYEINEVFGGGNGSDPYTTDGGTHWEENQGANIGNSTHEGSANTLMTGGLIHAAYGASNKKGTVYGSVSIDIGTGDNDCDLDLEKMVGAGKDADVNGDLIMVLGCKPNNPIPSVYGGADNAHVNGNIELTITSGNYKNVYGGNNAGGFILGHIKLNIEEGDCATPIIIENLYLGGNQAPYSMYGYYNAGTEQAPNYQPRTASMADPTSDDYQPDLTTIAGMTVRRRPDANTHSYAQPELNIISCTKIENVFGGGYGTQAIIYGDPVVNINMVPGPNAATNITGGNAHALGEIGNVYGGGNQAEVYGNTTVNIGTATTVEMTSVEDDPETVGDEKHPAVEGAYITGNVYGGGNLANVGKTHLGTSNGKTVDVIDLPGHTFVNIGAVKGDAILDEDEEPTGEYEYNPVYIEATTSNHYQGVIIKGNVFGGGTGEAATSGSGAFRCGKAMVTGGTNIHIGNGTVGTLDANDKLVEGTGNVYGGGEIGRVETDGVVMIGLPVGDGETSKPMILGNVFGGGKGVKTHGYAALLRGNTYVTVQADAKVGRSVYGGGQIASVGKYNVADAAYHTSHPEVEEGMPYSLGNENSGYCNVIVRGNAEIGPDNMKMYYEDGTPPDDEGHVFGAGKGILPYEGLQENEKPGRMTPGNTMEYYTLADYHPTGTETYEDAYLRFIESQALATHTEVLVDGNAFVKGSVYGGSLSGHVQHDTHVTISGDCQIGNGDGKNRRYTDTEWANAKPADFTECAQWEYDEENDAPYDPYAKYEIGGKYYYDEHPDNYYSSGGEYYFDEAHTQPIYANGGSYIAKDGHTYYGNVFGGGSGVVSYAPGKWHREAGTVGGNAVVDIKGGHILTSVYGGNEHTDVGTYDRSNNNRVLISGTGSCTINMVGGTVGVPRTKTAIIAHPVTCYVFGGGKGDPRTNFNTWTNVGEAHVNISGDARIYGSTFGGGEDGHVLGNAETNIGDDVIIGTAPNDQTYHYSNVIIGSQGLSGADGNVFGGGRGFSEEALTAGVVCGNVTVNIHNGKMLGSIFGGGRLASVGTYLVAPESDLYGKLQRDVAAQAATYYEAEDEEVVAGTKEVGEVKTPAVTASSHGHISINIYGGTIGATDAQQTTTSSIGDVFGGCKGSGNNKHFGLAKHTVINMTGGTVNGNVYGGGELGYVGEAIYNDETKVYSWTEAEEDDDDAIAGLCTVGISGGTVKGNVFGAGKGLADDFDCEKALVRTTSVAISGTSTSVGGNVYGGGEIGRVDQDTEVTIGSGDGTANGTAAPTITGSVFGAGAGVETHGYSALVRGNATVTIQGNANVGQSVYGGGQIASVGRYALDKFQMPSLLVSGGICTVDVKGWTKIGTSTDGGNVFGACRGVTPDYKYGSEYEKENWSKRMVKYSAGFVAGKTEHTDWDFIRTYTDAEKVDDNITKYIWDYMTSDTDYLSYLETLALATEPRVTISGNTNINGDVFGGGERGLTKGSVTVNILGGTVVHDVYGGGALANTNISNWTKYGGDTPNDDSDDLWNWTDESLKSAKYTTTVNLHGGTIGHNVYGGGLGQKHKDAVPGQEATDAVGTEDEPGYVPAQPAVEAQDEMPAIAALVYGDVLVKLNETIATDNCIVKGVIHGANNYNGSPLGDVTVHVYATMHDGKTNLTDKFSRDKDVEDALADDDATAAALKVFLADKMSIATLWGIDITEYQTVYGNSGANAAAVKTAITGISDAIIAAEAAATDEQKTTINANVNALRYDLKAVYGGGNEAAYDTEIYYEDYFTDSDNANRKAHVIIDGCDLTSIETVYGGGNAAATPATHVEVNSCYEIGTVFGGGNGKDVLEDGSKNPGADVGYKPNDEGGKDSYGTGIALAELHGGTIHSAFGGSNTLGNVRTSGTVTLDEADPEGCALCIEEVYGAGNEADQDGTSNINLGCLSYLSEIYGGAKNADINNNIELNIQSGRFNRVFGGNNLGGAISGTITVNIEETGCHPIVIGQLFGGGNQAAYTAPSGKPGPTVNVKSFTSIGEIYGGGYGASAVVTGNTYININEYKGKYADEEATVEFTDENGNPVIENDVRVKVSENTGKWIHFVADASNSNNIATVWQPEHREGAIGTIGNVFGGGNEAGVTGSTNVRIGNMSYVPIASVVAGTTDVRGYYILSGEGTKESPYVYTLVSDLPVSPVSGVTYYVKENENYNEATITAEVTDVRDYYTCSGMGTEQSPFVYTLVSDLPVLAEGSTTYYKLVLGANITGNVYGGGNAANVSGDTNVVIGKEP